MQAIEAELDELIGIFGQGPAPRDGAIALGASLDRIKQAERLVNSDINRNQKQVPSAANPPPVAEHTPQLEQLLEQEILLWLLKSGKTDIAKLLIQESPCELEWVDLEQCFAICRSLEQSDPLPAFAWAQAQPDLLRHLHELQFRLLARTDKLAAIGYLRENTKFDPRRPLVPALLGSGQEQREQLESTVQLLRARYMQSINQSPSCGLEIAVKNGFLALPVLAKGQALPRGAACDELPVDELPVDIDLPLSHYYHQIFVCPVSKQQTTPENPPVLLPCRHILAAETVKSIVDNSADRAEFKCPYCPRTASLMSLMTVSVGDEVG